MITVTGYKNTFDNAGYSKELTWDHFAATLSKVRVYPDKKQAPLFSPVEYLHSLDGFEYAGKDKDFLIYENAEGVKARTNARGTITRSNQNVRYVTMLVFDYDDGNVEISKVEDTWKAYNYVIHTTWSHTAEKPKFRLIIPLKNKLKPDEFKLIWEDVKKTAGSVDESCKDPARMFFWPSCKPGNEDIHYFKAQTTKKEFCPKILKRAPKKQKVKRGDYNTLDGVKWFKDHGLYLGTANQNNQHWVTCPWKEQHEHNTGDTDSVLWVEPEKWPTYNCSHNTCQRNERNIQQLLKLWGDGDSYCKKPFSRKNVVTSTEVKALGYDDSGHYYYQASKTNKVVRLKAADHRELNLYAITPDIDYWFKCYGDDEKGKVDWRECARDLMGKCNKAGYFKPSAIRGGGCWNDDDRVVVHLGSHLIVDGEKIDLTDMKSDYIYESAVQTIQHVDPLPMEEAEKLFNIIQRLPIRNNLQKVLFAGQTVSSLLSGCTPWRSHLWLVGDAGSGKSAILKNVLNPLWQPIGGIQAEGETTAAGLRQRAGHSAVPIVVDEVESNDKFSVKRIQEIIALARSTSSDSTAEVLKGTIDGFGMSFLVRCSFTLCSISEALEWAQDKERFCVISVHQSEQSKNNWPQLRSDIKALLTKKYSLAFYSRAVKMVKIIQHNTDILHRTILSMFPVATSRNADQISVLLSGAVSLFEDNEIDQERAKAIIQSIATDEQWSVLWEKDETDSPKNTLNALLSCIIKDDSNKNLSIGEIIEETGQPELLGNRCTLLYRYGLAIKDNTLWVSSTHPQTKNLFRYNGISGHYGLLSLIKGVIFDKVKFGTFSTKAVGIPLDLILN